MNQTCTARTVAEAVWRWRDPPKPAAAPAGAGVKSRAATQAAIMAVIGALLFFWLRHRAVATVAWALAAVVLGGGLFAPPVFLAIEKFGKLLGRWVGTGLTWGLLVPAFYLIFVPGRLMLAAKHKDPMFRAFPSDEPTYWVPHKAIPDKSRYGKQF